MFARTCTRLNHTVIHMTCMDITVVAHARSLRDRGFQMEGRVRCWLVNQWNLGRGTPEVLTCLFIHSSRRMSWSTSTLPTSTTFSRKDAAARG